MTIPTIALDSAGTGGPPAVKFHAPDDHVIVGIVDVKDYHQHNIDGVPQTWSDGTAKMGKRVTGLVVAGKGAYTGGSGEEIDVDAGDLVTFYCEGGRHYTWRDAVAEAGGVNVGDVMRWMFERTEPAKTRGFNDRKVYVAQIRRPEAKDGDLPARCVEQYQQLQNAPQVDGPDGGVSNAPAGAADDPF